MRMGSVDRVALATLLQRYGLEMVLIAPEELIPGSYWGDSEAGLKADHYAAVIANPPFFTAGQGTLAKGGARAADCRVHGRARRAST